MYGAYAFLKKWYYISSICVDQMLKSMFGSQPLRAIESFMFSQTNDSWF